MLKDENALVNGVKELGAVFHTRKPNKVFVELVSIIRSGQIEECLKT